MTLDIRQWTCTNCGRSHGRDLNAAINLKNMAASSAVTARGESRSGTSRKARVKRPSMKQELGFAPIVSYS
jgi:putative transposase